MLKNSTRACMRKQNSLSSLCTTLKQSITKLKSETLLSEIFVADNAPRGAKKQRLLGVSGFAESPGFKP
jgi:hypothetical protein